MVTAEPESTVCPEWPRDAAGTPLPLEGSPAEVGAVLDAQRRWEAVQALGGPTAATKWARYALYQGDEAQELALLEARMSMAVGGPKDQLEGIVL